LKILLIDDDSELTAMLAEYLAGEGFVAEQMHEATSGIASALTGKFDAVILDIMLPGSNGIDVLRAIRAKSDVPILMLTAKGDRTDRVLGLELGADDYITKPYFPPELVARLRAVLRRPSRAHEPAGVLRLQDLSCDPARRQVHWQEQLIELTVTEFNILSLLLGANDRVLTKEELSQQVLGRQHESYDRSLDVHISNLRLKMDKATSGALRIVTVRGVGWKMESAK
jgi:two-component system, OmpR family, response regulator